MHKIAENRMAVHTHTHTLLLLNNKRNGGDVNGIAPNRKNV